jgi:hypothetical protein
MRAVPSLALLLLPAATAAAQVPLSGPLSDSTTGPPMSGTVYHAVGTIRVDPGETLTIEHHPLRGLQGFVWVDGRG